LASYWENIFIINSVIDNLWSSIDFKNALNNLLTWYISFQELERPLMCEVLNFKNRITYLDD
jgi:hypothetical protein